MEAPSDDVRKAVVNFLNSEFGSDLSRLKNATDITEKIVSSKKELEIKLHPTTQEVSEITSFTKNAENAIENIIILKKQHEELQNVVKCHLEKMNPIKNNFVELLLAVKQLENMHNYLQWIMKIENTNCFMEEALKQGITSQMVAHFSVFKQIWSHLQNSGCKNLVSYAKRTMLYWHDILREKFGSEFQKVLSSLHWPVLSSTMAIPLSQSSDMLSKFSSLFIILYKLQLPIGFIKDPVKKGNLETHTMLLPLQLMLQPLQKRFVFHFMGKKQTNRLDKPEWYLSQILTWISDHSLFMNKNVQPLLEQEDLESVQARAELMHGLVHLAIIRLHIDLPSLLCEDNLLSHTIDEILLFEHELQNQGYPKIYTSILDALTKEPCFTRWKSLEHKSALEKMDELLNSESAWKPRYQDEDLDEFRVPECAEGFMTLLLAMTERYRNLPLVSCQLSFLELQLELLDDFRLRLHQLSQYQVQEQLQTNYCAIINAVHYVVSVLSEWSNLPFFLQLYQNMQFESKNANQNLQETNKEFRQESNSTFKSWNEVAADVSALTSDEEQKDGSVFDDAIQLLEHKQKDLLQTLGERVMMDIKAKSRPYRKEKWFCMPSLQDKKSMDVSTLAYSLLEIISCRLHSLQELLAKPLFTTLWQNLARELNLYLYEEVILQNSFSEGGAAQLNCDMTRYLFPIFGSYTHRPENYFKHVKESCILLNLNHAPAMLLRETLKQHEGFLEGNNALEELGVHSLSPSQALLVLSKRNDING